MIDWWLAGGGSLLGLLSALLAQSYSVQAIGHRCHGGVEESAKRVLLQLLKTRRTRKVLVEALCVMGLGHLLEKIPCHWRSNSESRRCQIPSSA